VIGGSEGVVVYGQLVRSSNVVKMLIYRPCANDVVRSIEVRTSLLDPVLALVYLLIAVLRPLCWPRPAPGGHGDGEDVLMCRYGEALVP
jgi:hypothetical protein